MNNENKNVEIGIVSKPYWSQAVKELNSTATSSHPSGVFDYITYSGTAVQETKQMYRPMTLKENMLARIEDNKLFNSNLATFTGVVSKDGAYKVAANCDKVMQNEISVDYDSFEGIEVNIDEVTEKEFWLIAMGGDTQENRKVYDEYKVAYFQHLANKHESIDEQVFFNFPSLRKEMFPSKKHLGVSKPELGAEKNKLHYIELSPALYDESTMLIRESSRWYDTGVNFAYR